MTATFDGAQYDGARADLLRRRETDAGQPSRNPLSGIAGSKEVEIALEEHKGLFARLGLTTGQTLAQRGDR